MKSDAVVPAQSLTPAILSTTTTLATTPVTRNLTQVTNSLAGLSLATAPQPYSEYSARGPAAPAFLAPPDPLAPPIQMPQPQRNAVASTSGFHHAAPLPRADKFTRLMRSNALSTSGVSRATAEKPTVDIIPYLRMWQDMTPAHRKFIGLSGFAKANKIDPINLASFVNENGLSPRGHAALPRNTE